MDFDIRWERGERYGIVRLKGDPTLHAFLAFMDAFAAESRRWSPARALIDLREVATLQQFTEQFAIGEAAARTLGHLERIASVVPAQRITRNSERPARRSGLNLRVFDSEEEAVAWLSEAG